MACSRGQSFEGPVYLAAKRSLSIFIKIALASFAEFVASARGGAAPHFFSALAMIAIIFFFSSGWMSDTTLIVALRVFSASMKST